MRKIDGQILKNMLISGSNNLYNHYPEVDALNVFPVPDGDTGMNMNLTLTSGVMEIQNRSDNDVSTISKMFSRGLLMGARGNSGVITSQIFRGIAQGLENKEEINSIEFSSAIEKGVEVAYKAVIKPVEGTILTVVREASEYLKEHVKYTHSIEKTLDFFIKAAKDSLSRTPELLPILKEVGVVDSGGSGLVIIFEGMLAAVKGEFIERNLTTITAGQPLIAAAKMEGEEFGYCTEFIMTLGPDSVKKPFNEKRFTTVIGSHGNSLVVVKDEEIVKVHVHTMQPGSVLNYAQQFGEFLKLKIENMTEQHHALESGAYELSQQVDKKEKIPYAIVAVSSGSGIDEYFSELGVTNIISGGQTMNPSSEDILKAINKANAKSVYVLPNNSNIVMAANQASELVDEDTTVYVVPTKSIPQGIVAAINFNEEETPMNNFKSMKSALETVKSGEVTFAIRDTEMNGISIKKDEFMGIFDGEISVTNKDKIKVLHKLIKKMVDDNTSLITVLCGEDVSEEEQEEIQSYLEDKYDELDIDIRKGNQNIYSFIIGVE